MSSTTIKDLALLAHVHAYGFDASTRSTTGGVHLRCSQCQALAINGIGTHEHGCPHAVHVCKGCNALVPVRVRYCAECS